VLLHGVGGRTVAKLTASDLGVVQRAMPDIVILEIGSNDLTNSPPEVVESAIDKLVTILKQLYKIMCVYAALYHKVSPPHHTLGAFGTKLKSCTNILMQYWNTPKEFFVGHTALFPDLLIT